MALLVIANQQPGPLPWQGTFNSVSDEMGTLIVSGSVWSQTPNQMIGFLVALDGTVVGSAGIYSNLQSTHRAVVPTYIPIQLTYGEHTIALIPTPETTTDVNDFFTVALEY